jgi:hypothetical protein
MMRKDHSRAFSVTQDQLDSGTPFFGRTIRAWRDVEGESTECLVCGGAWHPIVVIFDDGTELQVVLHRRPGKVEPITKEDAEYLKGEPAPLVIMVPVTIEKDS